MFSSNPNSASASAGRAAAAFTGSRPAHAGDRASRAPFASGFAGRFKKIGRRWTPAPLLWLRAWWRGKEWRPPLGRVRFGSFARTTPVSRSFGFNRGQPIDRHYIECFLAKHSADIRGRVLEIADNAYTLRFGGDRVESSEVLHALPGNPNATLVADLTDGATIPSDAFDCIVLTQTLLCIYDVRAAVRTLHRILRPGGVVLATVPGIQQIARPDVDLWGDYWRFTSLSVRRLFAEAFSPELVKVETFGNVKTAIAFLHGLAVEEMRAKDLEASDPDYQVTIAVRAQK